MAWYTRGLQAFRSGLGSRTSVPHSLERAVRWMSTSPETQVQAKNDLDTMIYLASTLIGVIGFSYASVPLYRAFCQATGYGGTVNKHAEDRLKVEDMVPIEERELTVRFNADTSANMQWKFRPQQKEVKLVPGETALAFYTATNPTDKAVTGISTYNVVPYEAGLYFNKIQCFCFEEQRLNPNESVDMPVFFYIDPEFAEDPNLVDVDDITLSYTFFKAREQ
eukprot:m.128737 g.128737  ORF g.128737 m.128737 type:complete len:222 (-) comp13875_c1_seq18:280-945(-)